MGEVDGRNGTDELIGSGFGGRIVLIARPPGYGLRGAATEPLPPAPASQLATRRQVDAACGSRERAWRIAAVAGESAARELSPLSYRGGFGPPSAEAPR